MSDTNWISQLKPGDKVFVTSRHGTFLRTVDRLTNTQVVLRESDSRRRWRIRDGHQVGSSGWDSSLLVQATPERVQKYRRRLLVRRFRDLAASANLSRIADKQLSAMIALMSKTDEKHLPDSTQPSNISQQRSTEEEPNE